MLENKTSEELMKLLSNPTRRAILEWLKNPQDAFAEYTQLFDYHVHGVCASLIQDKAGLSQPATSLCLKMLADYGLVEAQKIGKWTYYKRNNEKVTEIATRLCQELNELQ